MTVDRRGSTEAAPRRDLRDASEAAAGGGGARLAERHIRIGWWCLFVFVVLGSALEAFHGFKIQWYLAATNETRRHLWTLAHAHGTLLAIVNVVFGLSLRAGTGPPGATRVLASRALLLATALLPSGFFLGGVVIYAGDPGLGVLLAPLGAALLALALFLIARGARRP